MSDAVATGDNSGVIALVVAGATGTVAVLLQREKLKQEFRTEFMAERALVDLLEHPNWTLRSFSAIQRRVGGFQEAALRRPLVRPGALRFEDKDGHELWGLRRRNDERLG